MTSQKVVNEGQMDLDSVDLLGSNIGNFTESYESKMESDSFKMDSAHDIIVLSMNTWDFTEIHECQIKLDSFKMNSTYDIIIWA